LKVVMRMRFVFLAVIIMGYGLYPGCEDKSTNVKKIPIIEKLQAAVVEVSVAACRICPNFDNPTAYPLDTRFKLELSNTNVGDSIHGVAIDSMKLYLSAGDACIGKVDFDPGACFDLAPAKIDTVVVEKHSTHNDINESHCGQTIYIDLYISEETGGQRSFRKEGFIMGCYP